MNLGRRDSGEKFNCVVRSQESPQWPLTSGIHLLVHSQIWWPVDYSRSNSMSLLRWGYKSHCSFHLGHSNLWPITWGKVSCQLWADCKEDCVMENSASNHSQRGKKFSCWQPCEGLVSGSSTPDQASDDDSFMRNPDWKRVAKTLLGSWSPETTSDNTFCCFEIIHYTAAENLYTRRCWICCLGFLKESE